jgi:ion channel-forming bestrophin family protein
MPQIVLSFLSSTSIVLAHHVWHSLSGRALPPLSPTPHSFLATTVSLILVFRTNAAYDRYWEARKVRAPLPPDWRRERRVSMAPPRLTSHFPRAGGQVWGAVTNTVRNLARVCKTSMRPDSARSAALMVVAYAHALAQRLQQTRADEPCLTLLAETPDVAARILNANNRPLECLSALGELVEDEFETLERAGASMRMNIGADRVNAEDCLREMVSHLGATERLCTCPVPLSYSRHCSRMISIFVLTLPFVLVGQPGGVYMCVPACVLLTWALCGVDEVARMIEDPFQAQKYSLDIDAICSRIEKDLLEQMVPPLSPGTSSRTGGGHLSPGH